MKRNLTDSYVKAAKIPEGKTMLRVTDGGGMYLLVKKTGKYFFYDYPECFINTRIPCRLA